MATYYSDALLHKKINEVEVPVYYQTLVECVKIIEETGQTTLAAKLVEIATALNSKTTVAQVQAQIDEWFAGEVEGLPEYLNSFKEFSAEIANNQTAIEALDSLASKKVDKVEDHSLVADVVIAIISKISNEQIAAWNAAQANALESVTHNGKKLDIDENKNINITTTKMTMGTSFPEDMQDGDFHILIPTSTSGEST